MIICSIYFIIVFNCLGPGPRPIIASSSSLSVFSEGDNFPTTTSTEHSIGSGSGTAAAAAEIRKDRHNKEDLEEKSVGETESDANISIGSTITDATKVTKQIIMPQPQKCVTVSSNNTDANDQMDVTVTMVTPAKSPPLDVSSSHLDAPVQPKVFYPKSQFGNRMRSFNEVWFTKYPLIEYSVAADAVYCFVCRHFPPQNKSGYCDSSLCTGLRDWKNIDQKLSTHFKSSSHEDAFQKWNARKQTDKAGSVLSQLSSGLRKSTEQNRKAVQTLLRVALFCARQGIGLRGHREHENSDTDTSDEPNVKVAGEAEEHRVADENLYDNNKGNFLALVELLKLESKDIKERLDKLPRNAKYTAHNIQNEFITATATEMRINIVHEIIDLPSGNSDSNSVNRSKPMVFSIIVDEARDNSCTEIMSVCLRYVYCSEIKERFLGFIRLSKLDAVSMTEDIVEFVNKLGLDLKYCVAQAYDGASVMSGRLNGVQKLIRDKSHNPCPYVHCNAHRLNLVLVDISKTVDGVGDMFGLLEAIYAFQAVSTVRHKAFIYSQKELNSDEIGHIGKKMPQQSDTRWVCKYVGVQYFKQHYASVSSTLQQLTESHNRKEAAEARGLLVQFNSFVVIFYLNLFDKLLSITNQLSVTLQAKQLDLGSCRRLLNSCVKVVQDMRSDKEFDRLWDETTKSATANDIPIPTVQGSSKKRKTRLPSLLLDHIVTTTVGDRSQSDEIDVVSLYRSKYFAVIDQFLGEMERRFTDNDDILAAVAACDPSSPSFLSEELLIDVAAQYSELLNIDVTYFKPQADVARKMILASGACKTSMDVYNELSKMPLAFPDLLKLFKLMATIPVTSASAERSFSAMRRIKSYLRASMAPTRTSDITLIAVEYQLSQLLLKDPSRVIDRFSSMGSRRLTLS